MDSEESDFELITAQDASEPTLNDLKLHLSDKNLAAVRTWLQPTRYDDVGFSDYKRHLVAHTPGTNLWIFQSQAYKTWHSGDQGILWLKGIPGAGKSVTAANMLILTYR